MSSKPCGRTKRQFQGQPPRVGQKQAQESRHRSTADEQETWQERHVNIEGKAGAVRSRSATASPKEDSRPRAAYAISGTPPQELVVGEKIPSDDPLVGRPQQDPPAMRLRRVT